MTSCTILRASIICLSLRICSVLGSARCILRSTFFLSSLLLAFHTLLYPSLLCHVSFSPTPFSCLSLPPHPSPSFRQAPSLQSDGHPPSARPTTTTTKKDRHSEGESGPNAAQKDGAFKWGNAASKWGNAAMRYRGLSVIWCYTKDTMEQIAYCVLAIAYWLLFVSDISYWLCIPWWLVIDGCMYHHDVCLFCCATRKADHFCQCSLAIVHWPVILIGGVF